MLAVAERPPTATDVDLLRFATAGSVDDGKSTLIGRLLYETREILEDQWQAVERASVQKGTDYVDLALLTDGLRAEREQGITIDVAYRHFATGRRRFIMADTPGHVQYTRNMVTGTSTADLTVVLLDARKGVTEQTRRHLFIASLLRVPHVVVCVNKLDLVDYDQAVFEDVQRALLPLLDHLDLGATTFIPVSALRGDNVVERSERMPWYDGPSLLDHLESVPIARGEQTGARFPVQWVIRPVGDSDRRGYAGQVAGGMLRVGDEVVALPSSVASRIESIDALGHAVDLAVEPMSVSITLSDQVDVSRGDLLCHPLDRPIVGQSIEATLCWFATEPLRLDRRYLLKHTTRTVRASVQAVGYRVDINSYAHEPGVDGLRLNEIGRVSIRTTSPLLYDPYGRNRNTGSFILLDEATNATVAAGVIEA